MNAMRIWAILICLFAANASGQTAPTPDVIGVYFDEQATSIYATRAAFQLLDTYVVLSNPSAPAIIGWEAGIDITSPSLVFPATFPGGGTNGLTAPVYHVTYATPRPCGATTTLATIPMFLLDNTVHCIGMFGLGSQSVGNAAPVLYLEGGAYVPMSVNLLWAGGGNAVAQVNGTNPSLGGRPSCADVVNEEQLSWGALKSVFR